MDERKDKRLLQLLVADVIVALVIWAILLVLKGLGLVDMGWLAVLFGFAWISWLLMGLTALAVVIAREVVKLKRWNRRRKVDRRIKKQAEAAGVWGRPNALGGRSLDLHAQEWYGIKREPGETDAHLRRRCWAFILSDGEGGKRK